MKRQAIDPYTGPWTYGVDVSAYQPDVDWPLVARSDCYVAGERGGPCRFAIVRAADGVQTRDYSRPDPWAVRHLVGAHEAGLAVDAYHYVRAWHRPSAQVDVILDVLRTAAVPVRIVWLDVEGRPDVPTTPADEAAGIFWRPAGEDVSVTVPAAMQCLAAMRRGLERAGYRVGIYSGVTWHWSIAQAGLDVSSWADVPLWTPYYTRGERPSLPVGPRGEPWPWPHADIWQAAGSATIPGSVAGIRGVCDVNRYRGDETAFREWREPAAWRPTLPAPETLRAELVADLERLATRAKDAEDQGAVAELLRCAERLS